MTGTQREGTGSGTGGGTAVLDREDTATSYPEVEDLIKDLGLGGTTQDSSITVIENPLVNGHTGILLSRYSRHNEKPRKLEEVLHLRVDENMNVVVSNQYNAVGIKKGTIDGKPYHCVIADGGKRLAFPSAVPYEICDIPAAEYESLISKLERGDERNIIAEIYNVLAERVQSFSLKNGCLVLPENYACLRV